MAKAKKKTTKKTTEKKTTKKATKKVAKKAAKKSAKKSVKTVVKTTLTKTLKRAAQRAAPTKAAPKAVTAKKSVTPPAGPSLGVGQSVPDFEVPATGGRNIRFSELHGHRVVLYFYPKDMTPGCTIEGRDFSRLKNDFDAQNAVILGVSRDTVSSHEKFKSKEDYCIELLSDVDERLCRAFGVIKTKNMYGKEVLGIERSTFVIGADGKLEKEWRGVTVEGHADAVLSYLKGA
jgi:thioredoxin-dependent peroxiredoxin